MASFQDQVLLGAIDTFDQQVGEVTQFWFVAETVNEVARTDRQVLRAFQSSALFRLTARAGLEYQGIVALGRNLQAAWYEFVQRRFSTRSAIAH